MLVSIKTSHAEGTKEFMPYNPATMPTEITQLFLDKGLHRAPFAQLGCLAQYRLNIYISNPATEKIYIGLNDGSENLYYQVRDPNGTIVPGFALSAIPASGAGYIASWTQAFNGPNISGSSPSGYTPKIITPTIAGNYYIEFAADASGTGIYGKQVTYFDATVAQNTTPIPGRVWSKAWQIYSGGQYSTPIPGTQTFSSFYIYTDDGIVSKLNLNGLCGGASTIYCNQWGVTNGGNWFQDRKSSNIWPSTGDAPQYKIFLNDPDINVYPTGLLGQICEVISESHCNGTIDIKLRVSKPGSVTINIDCEPMGEGAEDITLTEI